MHVEVQELPFEKVTSPLARVLCVTQDIWAYTNKLLEMD